MFDQALSNFLYLTLIDAVIFIAPPLLISTVIAFIVSLFQAVTQIQDQTLPQTVKIVSIAFILLVFGRALAAPLFLKSQDLFENFHVYVN